MRYFPIRHYKVLRADCLLTKTELQQLKTDLFISGLVIQSMFTWNERAALSAYMEAFMLTAKNSIQDESTLRGVFYEGIANWFAENHPGEVLKYRLKNTQFDGIEVAHALRIVAQRISKGSKELKIYFSASPHADSQELQAELIAIENEFLPEETLPHTIYMQLVLFNYLVSAKKKNVWEYSMEIIKKCFGIKSFSAN